MKTCKKGLHQYDEGKKQCPECARVAKAAYFAANYEKEHARSAARYAANPDKLNAFSRALRADNPEQRKIGDAAYVENNAERVKAAKEKWRAENPEKNRLAGANYYKNNRVKVLAWGAAYHLAHPEKQKARSAAWKAANPEAVRVHTLNRQAKKQGNGGAISKGLAAKLFAEQKGVCPCCFEPLGDDYHMDHIMPLSLGGPNTDDNIQLLKARCNLQKGSKHPDIWARERGISI